MKNPIIFLNQMIVWLVMFLFKIIYEMEIIDKGISIEKNRKYIIVSNHASKIDPFIITRFIPKKNKFLLLPYRYLTTDSYMRKKYFNFILGFLCSFPDKNALKLAQKFINRKETVFMFPEGKLNRKNKLDNSIKLGIGAIYLERENPDLYLLPVRIEYFGKRKIRIIYKKPFRHKQFPKDLSPLIKDTMERVYSTNL